MCGTWMPCTPMSSRRRMNAGSNPGVRTIGVMPTRSAAITMSCTSRRSKLVCSMSMNAASKPACPMISTIWGSAMPPVYVPSARPPSRRMRLTRLACMGPSLVDTRHGDPIRAHRVHHHRLVHRGGVDLQNVEVVRAGELVVHDRGGLEHAVAGLERVLAVALVHEADPALEHVEHLEVAQMLVEPGGVQVVVPRRLLLDADHM